MPKIYNMEFEPRITWRSVYTLAGGDSAHHKNIQQMSLQKKDGSLANKQ